MLETRYRANIQTKDQQFSETMFLGLRLTEGVDLRSLKKKFGENIVNKYKDEIADLIKEGLLSLDGFRLRLTQRGLFLANEVFEKFV
jgi:oxygen-independent coproporphyrinogen-3 oxidase